MLAHRLDVLGAAHERERDEVDAGGLAVTEQLQVLLGKRGQRARRPWNVEPLARGDGAAGLHLQLDLPARGAHLHDAQAHGAVGEVQGGVLLDGVGEPGPGDAHLVRVALELIATADHEALAGRELDDAFAHWPDAQLGPGEVLKDRDRTARGARRIAHAADRLRMLIGSSVRIVQPRDVHARID